MEAIFIKLNAYFASDYLRHAWWLLLLGYPLAYALVFILARAGPIDRTVIFRCRRAWATGMFLHALLVVGFAIRWLVLYGYFSSFWCYFPWYFGMGFLDAYVILAAMHSINRFAHYDL